ncbi:MAG: hypothetical protein Q8P49_02795 [Candidatus Liptonbacteria bacterium]|nr:hypothetical protein [Candidatus Liptonbacteria bacterium]
MAIIEQAPIENSSGIKRLEEEIAGLKGEISDAAGDEERASELKKRMKLLSDKLEDEKSGNTSDIT